MLNAELFYQSLKQRGIETQLVVYPDTHHGGWKDEFEKDRLRADQSVVRQAPRSNAEGREQSPRPSRRCGSTGRCAQRRSVASTSIESPGSVEHLRLLAHALAASRVAIAEAEQTLRLALSLQAGNPAPARGSRQRAVHCSSASKKRCPASSRRSGSSPACRWRTRSSARRSPRWVAAQRSRRSVRGVLRAGSPEGHGRAGDGPSARGPQGPKPIETLRTALRENPGQRRCDACARAIILTSTKRSTSAMPKHCCAARRRWRPDFAVAWQMLAVLLHEAGRHAGGDRRVPHVHRARTRATPISWARTRPAPRRTSATCEKASEAFAAIAGAESAGAGHLHGPRPRAQDARRPGRRTEGLSRGHRAAGRSSAKSTGAWRT